MGHYGSEMEDRPADRFDYKAVNSLGFKFVFVRHSSTTVMRCPGCFALVEGEFAVAHFMASHANRLATAAEE